MTASPVLGPSSMARGLLSVLMPFVLLGAIGAGCLGPDTGEGSSSSLPGASARERPVVVAIIDTGVNPYHGAFLSPPGGVSVASLPDALAAAETVHLSSKGSYEERRAADAGFWDGVGAERLYAFAGTRVLAMSMSVHPANPRILDVKEHGTGTAALVAREAPDAIVVVIQIDTTICDPGRLADECSILSKSAPAMVWAAEQPWIDVISLSLGFPANAPFHPAYNPGMQAFLEASRLAHDRGKLIVAGAGNTVAPPLAHYYGGPPWVIVAGGANPVTRGESADASKGVDVLANYTEYVPRQDSVDGHHWSGGTSYSAPIVAGTLARAIAALREQGNAAPAKDLREALNATAIHFQPTEWDPTKPPTNDSRENLITYTLPVVAPFAQMGWGYVHGGMAEEIARRVREQDLQPPAEKATTARYQAQWQGLREAYWKPYT